LFGFPGEGVLTTAATDNEDFHNVVSVSWDKKACFFTPILN